MVKKLLKHELYALFRILMYFGIAVVVFGALGRLLLAIEVKNGTGNDAQTTFTAVIIGSIRLRWMLFVI